MIRISLFPRNRVRRVFFYNFRLDTSSFLRLSFSPPRLIFLLFFFHRIKFLLIISNFYFFLSRFPSPLFSSFYETNSSLTSSVHNEINAALFAIRGYTLPRERSRVKISRIFVLMLTFVRTVIS